MNVESATLSPDGKTVTLKIPEIKPVMQMVITTRIKAADGTDIRQEIDNTINFVP